MSAARRRRATRRSSRESIDRSPHVRGRSVAVESTSRVHSSGRSPSAALGAGRRRSTAGRDRVSRSWSRSRPSRRAKLRRHAAGPGPRSARPLWPRCDLCQPGTELCPTLGYEPAAPSRAVVPRARRRRRPSHSLQERGSRVPAIYRQRACWPLPRRSRSAHPAVPAAMTVCREGRRGRPVGDIGLLGREPATCAHPDSRECERPRASRPGRRRGRRGSVVPRVLGPPATHSCIDDRLCGRRTRLVFRWYEVRPPARPRPLKRRQDPRCAGGQRRGR